MEDTLTLLIVAVIVAFGIYLGARGKRKKSFDGPLPSVAAQRSLRFQIFYRKNGRIQIPWVTIVISIILIIVYMVLGTPETRRSELFKKAQDAHLLDSSVFVAISICQEHPQTPGCRNSISSFILLGKKLKALEPLSESDFSTFARSADFDGRFIEVYHQEKDPSSEQVLKDLMAFKKLSDEIRVLEDTALSKENLSGKTLLTSQITHANLSHLTNNVISLLFLGCLVEGWLGPIFYFFLYVVSGTLAMALYVKCFADPRVSVLGASANISGIVAAFVYYKIKVVHQISRESLQALVIQFAYFFYIFFGSDVVGIMEHRQGVAYGVHLLAAFFGLIVLLVRERSLSRPP